VGDDIGGYIGTTSKELFIRWIEVGAFEPFMRNHKEAFSNANEPWSYGEEAEAIAKEYIGFRYRLMPYLYSKFYESTQTGMPIVRSLCIENPFDEEVFDMLYQYQFLCGDAILVIPLTSAEKSKKFYLPEGKWYDLYSDEWLEGSQELARECKIHEIPLYIKASSIIPMQSLVQSTKEKPSDTLFIHIYNGEKMNSFEYYEDDGSTMDYQNNVFYKRTITFDPDKNLITFSRPEGSYVSKFKFIRCVFHGFEGVKETKVNGNSILLNYQTVKLLDGLRYLQDLYDPAYFKILRDEELRKSQFVINFLNVNEEINIVWE
jgi:alpha-glucosidase